VTGKPPRPLDAEALALFARKGLEGGPNVPQAGEANGVKVRRILQLTRDLARKPLSGLRILDLGCGEGVYAIEAALRGAEVVALDARTERMREGAEVAARHGLRNVRFAQDDVRTVTKETHGVFDAIWLLGLLYHLDIPDLFRVIENLRGLCGGLLLIDTLVSLAPTAKAMHQGAEFEGERVREHEDGDPPEARRKRLLRSIDNTFAFRLTKASLVRLLQATGFATVLECHAPLEPGKAADRVTLAALAGEGVALATYPWVNGLAEEEVARRLGHGR
jgi:SAM-dependent methyltransferase